MKIQVACPECLRSAGLDSSLVGKKVRCKGCGHVFKVVEDESEADAAPDSSWLDDGADGEAAEPAPTIPRGASAAGGPPLGLMIGLGAGGALLLSLVVGFFVFGGGRAAAPEPNRQPEPGLFDRAVTAVTGYDSATDPAKYPDLGPLPPPLLAPSAPRDLSAHERQSRMIIAAIDRMTGILATAHDPASLKATGERLQDESRRFTDEMRQNPPPFPLSIAERDEVARRTAGEIRQAVARLEQETKRISKLPGLDVAGIQLTGLIHELAAPLEADLRRAESAPEPQSGPPPYAEIFVQLQSADDADFFRRWLNKTLEEDGRPMGFQGSVLTQGDSPRASYRVWPVDSPQTFARQIPFSQARVEGRQIFLKAEQVPSAELAAAQDALRQVEEDRERESEARAAEFRVKMGGPRDDPNDPAAPPDADELTRALFATRSSNAGKRKRGVDEILKAEPDDARRDEVHKQLAALLADPDIFFVDDVMKAMVRWRTDETAPALAKMLNHSNFAVRGESAELLGELRDPRAAEPLAARLKEDAFQAAPALKKLGPAAEPALIPRLRDPDPEVRAQACKILEVVGGKDALEAMMSLPADSNFHVQVAARNAMRAISARVGPVAPPGKNSAKKGPLGKPR